MFQVAVQINAYVDDSFPGVVSCELRDTKDRVWRFVEKVPVVSLGNLTAATSYPQRGEIRCNVLSRSADASGRGIALIDTAVPDGVESTDGATTFEVFAEQIAEVEVLPNNSLQRP